MARSLETDSLSRDKGEVMALYQEYKSGEENSNILIFKGCTAVSGDALVPFLKISNIVTPFAVKTTKEFEIDLYKEFDVISYELSNHILTARSVVDSSKF